ncbi:hypothetical protein [Reyranella sp.]
MGGDHRADDANGAKIGLALYGRINDVQFRRLLLGLLCLWGLTLILSLR